MLIIQEKGASTIKGTNVNQEKRYIDSLGYNGNEDVREMLASVFYLDNSGEREARLFAEGAVDNNNFREVPHYGEKLNESDKQYWVRRVQEPDIQSLERDRLERLRDRLVHGVFSRGNPKVLEKWLRSFKSSSNNAFINYSAGLTDENLNGYSSNSDYQGTSAFNGKAPSNQGWYNSIEEAVEAWNNGE